METYALDKDFNLVTYGIPYDNLQWSRRYYTFGSFTMQLPVGAYDESWAYIGLSDRDELGMVQKFAYQGQDSIMISGFFAEKMLDDRVIYSTYHSKWSQGTGGAWNHENEAAIIEMVRKYGYGLPIELMENVPPLVGDITIEAYGDPLGEKVYSILETMELSWRLRYDYEQNKLVFNIWKGLDRTQGQSENSTQTFNQDFGNIGNRTVNIDDSAYKNYAYVVYDEDDRGESRKQIIIDQTNGDTRREALIDLSSSHPGDRQTYAEFEAEVRQTALEQLANFAKVEEVDIQVLSDKGYRDDYDLGDVCDIYFTDLSIEMQARIVEVDEVFKKEGHEITVGLGNKRISRIRRAVLNR